MFVSGSNSPRRLALPAPASSRTVQAQPAHRSEDRRDERRASAQTDRRGRRRTDQTAEPAIDRATSASGVQVQADFPNPRRGLRADASERARYARAYDSAQALSQPAPGRSWERSA
ncbi:hypothetical protein ACFELO_12070 [Oceanicaulis sp. LC35]|uniref:hypothetical protein n=1 Tax=Oceanicaulis sp. LC35 TaxID=3349635 RepID=UPI003F84E4AB